MNYNIYFKIQDDNPSLIQKSNNQQQNNVKRSVLIILVNAANSSQVKQSYEIVPTQSPPSKVAFFGGGGGVVRIVEETHSLTPPWPRNNFHTVLTDFDAVSIWPEVRKCMLVINILTN